jgi:hypothetical protein
MDTFVDPRILLRGSAPPPIGLIAVGAADYSRPDPAYGFLGTADTTFAGVPMIASSPLECNTKAASLAMKYNEFAIMKHNLKTYEQDFGAFQLRVRSECDCLNRSECSKNLSDGVIDLQPSLCPRWKFGSVPVRPVQPAPLENRFTPVEILLYNAVGEQTVRCIDSGTCNYSLDTTGGVPAITDLAWSFFADAAGAPFGMQCQVHFRKCTALDADENAITGTGGAADLGRRALATVPYKRGDCADSKVGLPTTECTALASKIDTEDDPALTWWYSIPDDGAQLSKANEIERICANYDTPGIRPLSECTCQKAETREAFQLLKSNFATTSKLCWYLPCALKSRDQLLKPAEEAYVCNANVCQAINNWINNTDIKLNDLKNTVNCTESEWESAGAGGGGGGGDIISGATNKIIEVASGLDWGAIVGIVVASVIVLLLMAWAARLWFSDQTKAAVVAPPAGAAVVAPPAGAAVVAPSSSSSSTK